MLTKPCAFLDHYVKKHHIFVSGERDEDNALEKAIEDTQSALWSKNLKDLKEAQTQIESYYVVPETIKEVVKAMRYVIGVRRNFKKERGLLILLEAYSYFQDLDDADCTVLAESLYATVDVVMDGHCEAMDLLLKDKTLPEKTRSELRKIIRLDLDYVATGTLKPRCPYPQSLDDITKPLLEITTECEEGSLFYESLNGDENFKKLTLFMKSKTGSIQFRPKKWLPSSLINTILPKVTSREMQRSLFTEFRASWSVLKPWIDKHTLFAPQLIASSHRRKMNPEHMGYNRYNYSVRFVLDHEIEDFLKDLDRECATTLLQSTRGRTNTYKKALLRKIIQEKIQVSPKSVAGFVGRRSSREVYALAAYYIKGQKDHKEVIERMLENMFDENSGSLIPENLLPEAMIYTRELIERKQKWSRRAGYAQRIKDLKDLLRELRERAVQSKRARIKLSGIFNKRKVS